MFLSKEQHKQANNLFQSIKNREIQPFIVSPVLSEVYKHLCFKKGKSYAESTILSFLKEYPIHVVGINQNLAIKAGELKCAYRKKLSYIDCFVIALALIYKYEVHTTERRLRLDEFNYFDDHELSN